MTTAAHTTSRRAYILRSRKHRLAAFFAATLLSGLAATASAQECGSDADCDEGYTCEFYSVPCAVAPGEDVACDDEPAYGECVRAPMECETDDDCGYVWLGCYGGADSTEPAPEPGFCAPDENGDCEAADPLPEPEPGPGYCGFRDIPCEADADCPADFACQVVGETGVGCAVPDCGPDESCDVDPDPCGDLPEPEQIRACVPREIDCNADSDCPSEWTCVTETYGYCSGGGSTDEGSGEDGFAPDEPGDGEGAPRPDDGECFEETISRCLPPGLDVAWGGVYRDTAADANGENTNGPDAPGNGDDDGVFNGSDDDESGGSADASCSTGAVDVTTGGLPLLLLLAATLGAVVLRRR